MNNYVVAFDTANERISLGIGLLDRAKKTIDCIASREVGAFRASNVKLLPEIDALLADMGISRGEVACVVCRPWAPFVYRRAHLPCQRQGHCHWFGRAAVRRFHLRRSGMAAVG